MAAANDLRALIASRHSLIVAVTRDETSLRAPAAEAATQLSPAIGPRAARRPAGGSPPPVGAAR